MRELRAHIVAAKLGCDAVHPAVLRMSLMDIAKKENHQIAIAGRTRGENRLDSVAVR